MTAPNIIICETEEDRERQIATANQRAERQRQRSRVKAKSATVRRFVMHRANSRCEICGFGFSSILNVHHIQPVYMGGSARVLNLIALCPNCHGMVHHYNKAWLPGQSEAWSRGIQSAGYTEPQARKILLIASQEAIVNHDGTIQPHKHPESRAFVLRSELSTWEINA